MFEIMDVAARADLKSDVLRTSKAQAPAGWLPWQSSISEAALDAVIAQLDRCFAALNSQSGKAGHALTENDWLMSIRSRVGIPGGTCGFDLPAYYAWQHKDAAYRQEALQGWASTLAPLAESIYVLLKLLRDSGVPQKWRPNGVSSSKTCPLAARFNCCGCALIPLAD